MKILNSVWNEIIRTDYNLSCENGGLLGKNENGVIVKVAIDIPSYSDKYNICTYTPNIEQFNDTLAKWHKEKVIFGGIFHTHYSNKAVLSNADLSYISKILKFIPKGIKDLYFPILLLPDINFIPYKAMLNNGKVCITEDILEVIS